MGTQVVRPGGEGSILGHGMDHHFCYPRVEEIVRPRTVTSRPARPLTQRELVLASLLRRPDVAPRNGGR
jgi:hypothetical protein